MPSVPSTPIRINRTTGLPAARGDLGPLAARAMRLALIGLTTLGLSPLLAQETPAFRPAKEGKQLVFQSPAQRVPLLELFTSEGCSSCPPAEAWLSRQTNAPGLWKTFVPLAFHVEYWDNDQWRDPWSHRDYGDRQRQYASGWRRDTIYTPGFVWDGKEWTGWFQLPRLPAPVSEAAGVLTVVSGERRAWKLHFRPTLSAPGKLEGNLALLGCGITSEVRGGENAHRRLVHDFAVLRVVRVPLSGQTNGWTGAATLALPAGKVAPRLAVAAWISEGQSPHALQSTGGWLPARWLDAGEIAR